MDTDSLIDLTHNDKDEYGNRISSGEFIELKRRSPTTIDFFVKCGTGAFIGSLAGTLVGLIVDLITDSNEMGFLTILIGLSGGTLGLMVGLKILLNEVKNGFFRVDENFLEFPVRGTKKSIPMETVFSAGTMDDVFGKPFRIYFESDHQRGFDFTGRTLRAYIQDSGPAMSTGLEDEDGNSLARAIIKFFMDKRKRSGKPICALPPFMYEAKTRGLKNILFGDKVVSAEFSCDGETLNYSDAKGTYTIPVKSVQSVKVVKVQSQYGTTRHDVTVGTGGAGGVEKIKIMMMGMTYADEVAIYCQALPSLFEAASSTSSNSGYWD